MDKKTLIYVVKRLLFAVLTIFVVITITFWAMQAIPGGPFTSEKAKSEETLARLKELYGLDKPLGIQYLLYLGNAFIWNFGYSIKSNGSVTVMQIIGEGMQTSAIVGFLAAALAIIVGIILGTVAGYKHNKTIDKIIMVLTTASVAVPTFITATILSYIFIIVLKILPPGYVAGGARAFILPVITMSLSPAAYISRLVRSATLDVLGSDYIRTANAKGLSKTKVLFKHALRNSLTPVITYAGPMIAFIITGSLVVESIYNVPGIGSSYVQSITNRDYPLVMGLTIFLTYLVIFMVLISDILYKVVNPRVDLD